MCPLPLRIGKQSENSYLRFLKPRRYLSTSITLGKVTGWCAAHVIGPVGPYYSSLKQSELPILIKCWEYTSSKKLNKLTERCFQAILSFPSHYTLHLVSLDEMFLNLWITRYSLAGLPAWSQDIDSTDVFLRKLVKDQKYRTFCLTYCHLIKKPRVPSERSVRNVSTTLREI